MEESVVMEAFAVAVVAPYSASGVFSGCGRAYVCVPGDRKLIAKVKRACARHGLRWLGKAYGTAGNAIYIGYDNGSGRALARSEAIAKSLRAFGIDAYADAVAD